MKRGGGMMKKPMMKRGGKAMKKRVKKIQGGMTKAEAKKFTSDMGSQKFTIKKPKKKMTEAEARKFTSSMKTKTFPGFKGGAGKDTPLKKSQLMNKKGTTYSGKLGDFMKKRNAPGGGTSAKERLAKIRANRKGGGMMKPKMMGGGMMKKRMKRGGKAK